MAAEYVDTPHGWIGHLSISLALTLNGDKWIGRETLKDFLKSQTVDARLQAMLREEMRK